MIKKISLQNFKIFSKLQIHPKRITVFTGPNGSGKSSIIQALMLLKQTSHARNLVLDGNYLKHNSFEDIQKDTGEPVSFGIDGDEDVYLPFNSKMKKLTKIDFSLSITYSKGNMSDFISEISMGDYHFNGEFRNQRPIEQEISIEQEGGAIKVKPDLNIYQPFAIAGHTGSMSETLRNNITQHINYIISSPGRIIEGFEYVPANRGFASPEYSLGNDATSSFSPSQNMPEYESEMATTLVYKRDILEQKISNWMDEITGTRIKPTIVPNRRVNILARKSKIKDPKEIRIAFEGFGSNQLLFILVPLAQIREGSTLMIEEPELHLHPRAQTRLTRRLINESKDKKTQIILTSHSEHILSSILTAVADRQLSIDDVAIYYFNRTGQSSSVKLLKVDASGRVKGGLPGFFDASIEEAERRLKALERG